MALPPNTTTAKLGEEILNFLANFQIVGYQDIDLAIKKSATTPPHEITQGQAKRGAEWTKKKHFIDMVAPDDTPLTHDHKNFDSYNHYARENLTSCPAYRADKLNYNGMPEKCNCMAIIVDPKLKLMFCPDCGYFGTYKTKRKY